MLIVSAIRLYGEGLAEILDRDDRLAVVGLAADAGRAVELALVERPDVVLLDLALGEARRVVRAIRDELPACRVVALGVSTAEEDVIAWAEAGVAGYVFREASVDDLVTAVDSAMREELYCSGRVAGTLLRRVGTLSARRGPRTVPVRLTPRETEVVQLLDRGLSNKQIAGSLHIELPTVKNHLHNIFEKLAVHRRGQAVAALRDMGLLASRPPDRSPPPRG